MSKANSEKVGVDLWKNFDHQLSSLNQMIRLNKQGIMDLFEDSEHGVNANSGFFKLDKQGDKAYFCFKQDIDMIGKKLK